MKSYCGIDLYSINSVVVVQDMTEKAVYRKMLGKVCL